MRAAAALLLLAQSVLGAEPAMPLARGTTWIYRGTVRGNGEHDDRIVKNVTTTMRVVDYWMAGKYEIAILDPAGPYDVSCLREPPYVGSVAFARTAGSIWELRVKDPSTLKSEAVVRDEIGFDTPHVVQPLRGRSSIGCESKIDNLFCRTIVATQKRLEKVKGVDAQVLRATYTLTFRTVSDDRIEEYAPGIGLTRFRYEDHSAPCHQDFRLVEYRPAPAH